MAMALKPIGRPGGLGSVVGPLVCKLLSIVPLLLVLVASLSPSAGFRWVCRFVSTFDTDGLSLFQKEADDDLYEGFNNPAFARQPVITLCCEMSTAVLRMPCNAGTDREVRSCNTTTLNPQVISPPHQCRFPYTYRQESAAEVCTGPNSPSINVTY